MGWGRARYVRTDLWRSDRLPRARGIWRDDDRGGAPVRDEPVVIHCYTTPQDIEDAKSLPELGRFCGQMGREANQGEIGLVVGDEYFAIRDFEADTV